MASLARLNAPDTVLAVGGLGVQGFSGTAGGFGVMHGDARTGLDAIVGRLELAARSRA